MQLQKKMNKKGVQMNQLPGVVLTLGIIILITTVMAILNNDLKSDQVENTTAYNVTLDGETAYGNISGKFGLLGTIIILSAVILIVISAFSFRQRGGL